MKRLELKGKRTFFGDETMIIKKFLVQISPKSFISNTSNSWISNRNSNSLIFEILHPNPHNLIFSNSFNSSSNVITNFAHNQTLTFKIIKSNVLFCKVGLIKEFLQ